MAKKLPGARQLQPIGAAGMMSTSTEEGDLVNDVLDIPLALIERNPDQPRQIFDKEALEELAASLNERGLLSPILVYTMPTGKYRIGAGERRWRAATALGWKTIRASVRPFVSELEADLDALTENEVRKDLRSIEVVWKVASLINSGLSPDDIVQRTGMNRSSVGKYELISHFPDLMKRVEDGEISATKAYEEAVTRNREAGERRGRPAQKQQAVSEGVVSTQVADLFREEKDTDIQAAQSAGTHGREAVSASALNDSGHVPAPVTSSKREPPANTIRVFGQYMNPQQFVNALRQLDEATHTEEAEDFVCNTEVGMVRQMVSLAVSISQRLQHLAEQ